MNYSNTSLWIVFILGTMSCVFNNFGLGALAIATAMLTISDAYFNNLNGIDND